MNTTAIIFVLGPAATYHLLSPWFPEGNWVPESAERYVGMLCGKVVAKSLLRERLLSDVTNLRLCGACKNRLKILPDYSEMVYEKIEANGGST